MNTTKFLNLPTAPTCSRQNHIAITILCVPLPLHFNFLLLLILLLPPDSHYYSDLSFIQPVSPSCFQSIQPTSLFMSSINNFNVLFLTLSERSRQRRACGTVLIKSTAVYNNSLSLHMHSPLIH